MANYWLTFRIEKVRVGDRGSDDRREALYDVIDKTSTGWWIEPTSFVIFDSEESISAIAKKCKAAVSPAHDIVLIRALDTKDAIAIGKVEYWDTLKAFMPYVSKL